MPGASPTHTGTTQGTGTIAISLYYSPFLYCSITSAADIADESTTRSHLVLVS